MPRVDDVDVVEEAVAARVAGEASVLVAWDALYRAVNGLPGFEGMPGIRSVEYPCELFDGKGYDGSGRCYSDGHYLCVECSELSPDAGRFVEHGRDGRADRLRAFLATSKRRRAVAF